MSDKEKNFLDKWLDAADSVVGKMEEGASNVYVEGKEKEADVSDAEVISYETTKAKTSKPSIIWGAIDLNYHLFEGFSQSSLCGRYFELNEFKHRKTEMDIDGFVVSCGTCLRILHSRYKSS